MNKEIETTKLETIKEVSAVTKIKLIEFHTKKYLENLKETTYKNKKVVFILPNGKEYE
jgi:hypothetical protein|nr:MAG TPA_asm: hypothetical protein [Caudoviricetes sp.]